MPNKTTLKKTRKLRNKKKAPTTQAGEFVREEMEHIRKGVHGARSAKQAIAIGLSKARRAGVPLPPYGKKKRSSTKIAHQKPSRRRSRAILNVLKKEPHSAASHLSLARQALRSAKARGREALREAAKKAAKTKGIRGLREAARKAARTRARHESHPG